VARWDAEQNGRVQRHAGIYFGARMVPRSGLVKFPRSVKDPVGSWGEELQFAEG